MHHIIKFVFCLFSIILIHGSFEWYINKPQDVGADVPAGKLMSLSFSPYRQGYSPLEKVYPLPEHIEEDMRLLADKTDSVRTYSSLGGMQPTPDIARKYGIKMIQGCWLGSGFKENKKEVEALIQSANANPDVVKKIIVGNEVLLRGEMDVDRLIGYIREVKRAVKQPVSYADVWSIYMKYPKLIHEVDFITIHILPYWEDEPISVQDSSEHLEKIVKQVEDEARGVAPGKPILIGETGWPSMGRQRGMAKPGVVNAARFIRGMIAVVNRHGFDYNIVEAFNQPWKSNLEGVVGANWGLFSVDRHPVFPLTGPVSEDSQWLAHFVSATLLCLFVSGFYFKKLRTVSLLRLVVFLGFIQVFAAWLIYLGYFLWGTSYSSWQQMYSIFMVITNGGLGVLLIRRCCMILAGGAGDPHLAEKLRILYLMFIAIALYKTFGLAVNGRYLSFPVEQFAIPVTGICVLILCLMFSVQRLGGRILSFNQLIGWDLSSRRDRIISYFLGFGLIGMILGEAKAFMDGRDFIQAHPGFSEGLPFALTYTFHNQQLLEWLVCLLILSIPFWNNTESKIGG